jgi:hypothetical protein
MRTMPVKNGMSSAASKLCKSAPNRGDCASGMRHFKGLRRKYQVRSKAGPEPHFLAFAPIRRAAGHGCSGLGFALSGQMPLQDTVLEHVGGLEGHDPARADRHFLAGLGLRPIRSFLSRTWKVAKDESLTLSPRTIALQTSSMTISTSSADSVRESPTLRNTASARSALVIVLPLIFSNQTGELFRRP